MGKKKVVFIISSSVGGGAQILLLDLAKSLRDKIDMMIVCPKGFLSEKLIENNFDPLISDVNLMTIRKIKKSILCWTKNDKFIVNAMLFGTSYYVCKAFNKNKNAKIFSLLLNPIIRSEMCWIKKIAYRYIAKQIGKYSDVIGVGSPELEREVVELTNKKPIYLENRVPNTQKEKKDFYDGSKPLNVCFVGRFSEQKRPDIFVKTAKITSNKNANIEYYMVGEGHLLPTIQEYILDNRIEKIVHLIGFQNDLYGFLEKMDILFLSSEFENTPLIMLNSMNASLPIVCGNVVGVTHLIDNYENGLISPKFDPSSFSELLIYLSNNPTMVEKMGRAAYKKATGELSYDNFVNLFLMVFNNLGD